MFCPQCGGTIGESQPFCGNCGTARPHVSQDVAATLKSAPAQQADVPKLVLTPAESQQIKNILSPVAAPPRLACKVCEGGVLLPKKIFRMSGPVVVIGYILLIPSFLGMIASALVLCGVLSYKGRHENSRTEVYSQPLTAEDAFRLSCINGSRQDPTFAEKQGRLLCECVLQAIEGEKEHSPEQNQKELRDVAEKLNRGLLDRNDVRLTAAMLFCAEHMNASASLSAEGERIYDGLEAPADAEHQSDAGTRLVHIVGGGLAIFWLITCFVSGLLGWLLVMKKRVLQCSVCGATVSAS